MGAKILSYLSSNLPALMWGAVGWVLSQLWTRFRSRPTALRWHATHQSLGVTAQDGLFGTVEVRYNGNPVPNLHFTIVDIENGSNTDLADVVINVLFNDGTLVFIAHGAILGSANNLPLGSPFDTELARFNAMGVNDPGRQPLMEWLLRRRDFRVPVFNREKTARISMVVQGPQGKAPFVSLATDSKGVKLAFMDKRGHLWGVNIGLAALVGLSSSAVAVYCLSTYAAQVPGLMLAFIAFAAGAMATIIGALLIRGFRWLFRQLG